MTWISLQTSGHSYKGTSTETTQPNFGGGGCAADIDIIVDGGGYGSKGKDGANNDNSGGNIYGNNKQLSIYYLGSGGGGGYNNDWNVTQEACGGSGCGALKIQCLGNITLKENASIYCDGDCGGSGGSIHIIVNNKENIQMSQSRYITAVGGDSVERGDSGNGGVGRIRLEFISNNNDTKYNKNWN
eukprot:98658_1